MFDSRNWVDGLLAVSGSTSRWNQLDAGGAVAQGNEVTFVDMPFQSSSKEALYS